jgi:hypothetical protein
VPNTPLLKTCRGVFPKHLRGEAWKVAKELIKKEVIMLKPTSYGLQVSLNPYKMAETEEMIKDP